MAARQAPMSLGFSRQEHRSGLPFPSPMNESEKWKWSHSVVSDPQQPHGLQLSRLLHPWDSPGKSTGVGCHCLLRFLTIETVFFCQIYVSECFFLSKCKDTESEEYGFKHWYCYLGVKWSWASEIIALTISFFFFPGKGNCYPLQYSYLENFMDRGAWRAIIHGISKSQTPLSD